MMDWAGLAAVITALAGFSSVILTVVNSRMKRAEERQRVELVRIEKETETAAKRNNARLSTIYSSIYGYLWKLLFKTNADRAGIIQPHPLHNKCFFSTSFEIIRPDSGVATFKNSFQCNRMNEWPAFVSHLANDEWTIYSSIETVKDRRVYSELHRRGVQSVFYRRLTDLDGNWVGSLYAEFCVRHPDVAEITLIKGELDKKATLIQDILPEYHPPELPNVEA